MEYYCNSETNEKVFKDQKEKLASRISQVIRLKRKERFLTQIELADILGISYQLLQRYEYGKNLPPIYILPKICKTLGIEIGELFELEIQDNEEVKNLNPDLQVVIKEYRNISRKLNGSSVAEVLLNLTGKSKK